MKSFMSGTISKMSTIAKPYEYLKQFVDYTYHIKYDPNRDNLHTDIINKYFVNKHPQKKNRLIFTGGCYGAGKSHVMKFLHKNKRIDLDKYIYVDQDKIREYLPEYSEYLKENHFTAGFRTNKESAYIAEFIQRHALFNNYNLIIDSSLRDGEWHRDYIEWIKQTFPHYEIVIIFVEASWVRILERNLKRGEQTKRCIPLECLENTFEASPISFEMLKSHVHRHYVINNDYKYKTNCDTENEQDKLENIGDIYFD